MKSKQIVLLLGVALVATFRVHADISIEGRVVGPANAGGVYAISPKGVHVAYAATKGSRLVVSIDGQEGPVFDELFNPVGQSFYSPPQVSVLTATAGGLNAGTVSPVIFSESGEHYAYVGRQGSEYVVIHDGKEIARGPRQTLALNYGPLALSPTGKHVFWDEMENTGSRSRWRLMMDGKAGPWSGHQTMTPVFSPDDSRYAFIAVDTEDQSKRTLVVDGKPAGYFGRQPVFTADSKTLLTIAANSAGKDNLLANGKPVVSGVSVGKIVTAPVGGRYGAIIQTKLINHMGVNSLFLDGKEIPGTDGAKDIWFSPNGKRYAAPCVDPAAGSGYVVVDGKKGPEYQSISEQIQYWTPDSSKLIYLAASGGRSFLVVENEEFAISSFVGGLQSPYVIFAEQGDGYMFGTRDGANRNFSVVVNGANVLPQALYPVDDTLTFTPDGSRYAYLVGPIGRSEVAGIVIDGVLHDQLAQNYFSKWAGMALRTHAYVFSRDGKRIARMARSAAQNGNGLYIDDTLVYGTQRTVGFPAFTPDSQHFFWTASELGEAPPAHFTVYCDGEPTVKFYESYFMNTKGSWEMGSDGALVFLTIDGNDVKRYRITPSADRSVAMLMKNAETERAQAIARAEAEAEAEREATAKAAAQAEADRIAAAAKAKADQEAALAKRKADYEAAVAAKQQARLDAINAKKLYILNGQRAKKGLPPLDKLPEGE